MNKKKKGKSKRKEKQKKRITYLIIGLISISIGLFVYFQYPGILLSPILANNSETKLYTFENDEIGSFPSGWRGTTWDGTEIVKWREESEGYGKVAEVMNRDGDGVEFANNFNEAKVGIIEFDMYGDNINLVYIQITQETAIYDPVDDIIIRVRGYGIQVNDRGIRKKVLDYSDHQWYHFKIEFDVDDDWHLTIDGKSIDNHVGYEYLLRPTYFRELYLASYSPNNRFYVDNIEITVIK